MKPLKCIIIEDNPIQAEILGGYCNESPDVVLSGIFEKATDAIKYLSINTEVDLIFLDVELPMMTGFEFLDALPRPIQTILVTSSEKHAIDAFKYQVLDYLVKPFSFARFLKAIEKAQPKTLDTRESIFVKVDGVHLKIILNEVRVFKAADDYVEIWLRGNKLLVKSTLSAIEEKLPPSLFMRIHRSHIVNLNAIDKVDGSFVEVAGNVLSCSKNYLPHLRSALGIE